MSTSTNTSPREEWLKIVGKGMVTIPKEWRDELGIKTGDVIKAKKEGKKFIFETISVPDYPIYTVSEVRSFINENENKIDNKMNHSYKEILDKTRGAWSGDKTLSKTLARRARIEKKASIRRKQQW